MSITALRINVFLGLVLVLTLICAGSVYGANDKGIEFKTDDYLTVGYRYTYLDTCKIDVQDFEKNTKKSLLDFIKETETKISEFYKDNRQLQHDEPKLVQLLCAYILVYNCLGEDKYLQKGLELAERLKNRLDDPCVAYWYHYTKALEGVEAKNADQVIKSCYGIYFDSIRKLELLAYKHPNRNIQAMQNDVPILYRNIFNLVVEKAIERKQIANLDAVGPLVLLLKGKLNPTKDVNAAHYEDYTSTICEYFTSNSTDNYGLNYSVAFYKGSKALSSGDPSKLPYARDWFLKALEWSNFSSIKGQINAITNILSASNKMMSAIIRDNGSLSDIPFSDADRIIKKATVLLDVVATEKSVPIGYINQDDYQSGVNALMISMSEFYSTSLKYFVYAHSKESVEETLRKECLAQLLSVSVLEPFNRLLASNSAYNVPKYLPYLIGVVSGKLATSYDRTAEFTKIDIYHGLAYKYMVKSILHFPFEQNSFVLAMKMNRSGNIMEKRDKIDLLFTTVKQYLKNSNIPLDEEFDIYSRFSNFEDFLKFTEENPTSNILDYKRSILNNNIHNTAFSISKILSKSGI